MFERFTDGARRVLALAQEEARLLNHSFIGTEHLLLGLVREGEGVASVVLVGLGADPGRVRHEVMKLMADGGEAYGAGLVDDVREPRCPQCRGSVADNARFRTMAVPPEPGDTGGAIEPILLDVVYCAQCGTTLHTFKAEGPR